MLQCYFMYERTSPHVIYNITRTVCDLIYVGCTKRILKVRIAEHIAGITRKGDNVSGATKHFLEKCAGSLDSFSFFDIEKVS